MSAVDPMSGHLVVCLCAAWCRVCEAYRSTFDGTAREFPGHRFVWLDVEDRSELTDGVDVEQFPTLVMAHGDELRFLGPLPPDQEALRRMLRAAAQGPCMRVDGDLSSWLRRLRRGLATDDL